MIHFDKTAFLTYLKSQFRPMDNHFTYEMTSNVIDLAAGQYPNDRLGLKTFLAGMIPELRPEEIDPFLKEN